MTKLFLVLAIGLFSFSAFADFKDETCKVKSMYDGEKFNTKYNGTFGLILTRENRFRMIFHSGAPYESFNYDEGVAGEMPEDTFKGFMEEWCPIMFSKKKCSQIKKVDWVEGEKSEGLGYMKFLDANNAVIARAAGMAGMVGICR